MSQIQKSYEILDKAVKKYYPSHIVLSFSGGYDSMVSSHIATRWHKRNEIEPEILTLSVDTLISADGWSQFVSSVAEQLEYPAFRIEATTHFDEWSQKMIDKGYVYRKSQHKINFYYLKQVIFRAYIQRLKTHRTDRIMFVNGVRRAESSDRSNTPYMSRSGCGVFVNPIADWDDYEVTDYRVAHDMPVNPFYEIVGNSGDCLCNWHTRIKPETVEQNSPKAWEQLAPIDRECKSRFGYGYGELPRNGTFTEGVGIQMSIFDLDGIEETPDLCSGCSKPQPNNAQVDSVYLQRFEWDDHHE